MLRNAPAVSGADVLAMRKNMEAVVSGLPPPEGARITPVDANGVPAEWTVADGARRLGSSEADLPRGVAYTPDPGFTLQMGTSPLLLSVAALGDAYGQPLSADLEDGLIAVVPEPQAALVFLVGRLVVRRAARARATHCRSAA